MPARLTIHLSEQPATTRFIGDRGVFLFGRDPQSDVVLDDPRVSRRHARLTINDDGSVLEDLQSKNGVAVDGRTTVAASLPDACWLSFGGLLIQYEAGPEVDADATAERVRRQATLSGHRALSEPGLDTRTLVDRLLASFVEMSGADRGFVLLARGGDRRFAVVASRALSAEAVASSEFSGSCSTVEHVLGEAAPVIQSDAQAGGPSSSRPSIVSGGIRALVCLPLLAAQRTLGAVYADSRRPGKTFNELDVEILGALASHAGLALWASGLQQELEGLARGLPTQVNDTAASPAPLPGFPTWSVPATPSRVEGRL